MINNDVLRRLRYAFDFSDKKVIKLFRMGGVIINLEQEQGFLKKEEEEGLQLLTDHDLAAFLNGLIIENRGMQEGREMIPEERLNNNMILLKLKIALSLRTEDVAELMDLAGMPIGKTEITALFRKKEHKNYRPCKQQFLRNFLQGLQKKHRSDA
ncbi:MAG: DUF1456 family protein [Desulfotalea sp.]